MKSSRAFKVTKINFLWMWVKKGSHVWIIQMHAWFVFMTILIMGASWVGTKERPNLAQRTSDWQKHNPSKPKPSLLAVALTETDHTC